MLFLLCFWVLFGDSENISHLLIWWLVWPVSAVVWAPREEPFCGYRPPFTIGSNAFRPLLLRGSVRDYPFHNSNTWSLDRITFHAQWMYTVLWLFDCWASRQRFRGEGGRVGQEIPSMEYLIQYWRQKHKIYIIRNLIKFSTKQIKQKMYLLKTFLENRS